MGTARQTLGERLDALEHRVGEGEKVDADCFEEILRLCKEVRDVLRTERRPEQGPVVRRKITIEEVFGPAATANDGKPETRGETDDQ